MRIAQAANLSISLIALTFLTGFVLAALIFGLVLRRKRPRATSTERAPKHALGSPVAKIAQTGASSTAITPSEPAEQEPAAPKQTDFIDVPTLPTDLFEQRYEAKFERTRRRLERLRTTLNDG